MPYRKGKKNLAQILRERSKEICRACGCTSRSHRCAHYAFVTRDSKLVDICPADRFQGADEPVATIQLPWRGTELELSKEIAYQLCEKFLPEEVSGNGREINNG